MWITSMGNHGAAGGISERRRSSFQLLHWLQNETGTVQGKLFYITITKSMYSWIMIHIHLMGEIWYINVMTIEIWNVTSMAIEFRCKDFHGQ